MKIRAHVYIKGDVTGVGFRSWTARNARSLGLKGWVRNSDMDTVEAVFEGSKEKTEEMIERCHKGPDIAWVDEVKVEWGEEAEQFEDFSIN